MTNIAEWKDYDIVWLDQNEPCEYVGELWSNGYSTSTAAPWITRWQYEPTPLVTLKNGAVQASANQWCCMVWEGGAPDAVVLRRHDRSIVINYVDLSLDLGQPPRLPAIRVPPHEFDAFVARFMISEPLNDGRHS